MSPWTWVNLASLCFDYYLKSRRNTGVPYTEHGVLNVFLLIIGVFRSKGCEGCPRPPTLKHKEPSR